MNDKLEHRTFTLTGLDCPDCALKLEKAVGRMTGVHSASANFASSKMSVQFDPSVADAASIARRIRSFGYGAESPGLHGEQSDSRMKTAATAVAGVGIVLGYIFRLSGLDDGANYAFAISLAAGGGYAARAALQSVRSLSPDMNLLMTIAAIGAAAIGDWFEAAMVMFLFSLGNALEARSVERTRRSIRSLIDAFPASARVKKDGGEIMVSMSDLAVGDVFIVLPGEKVPTDGLVVSGSTAVDQSPITGESAPVEKSAGDEVFAGSVNRHGSIDVRATAASEDNSLAKIIHLVEEAQAEKAPSQRFSESFGRYYTPAVLVAALLVAAVPSIFFGSPFQQMLYIALTLIVVSCPCALVISTPVAVVSAIGNAARNGVLIKGGSFLEAMGGVRAVAFDKTGTLTDGVLSVAEVFASEGFDADRVLKAAACVECRSEHPLAKAIVAEARRRGLAIDEPSGFLSSAGMGAEADAGGRKYAVGNARMMENMGIYISGHADVLETLSGQGRTSVIVAEDGAVAGIIALRDGVREGAGESVCMLKRAGLDVIMMTGDSEGAAHSAAGELGIGEVYSQLLPEGKVEVVRALKERYGDRLCVVGDGVNDAPALAMSTVGVAMGAAGSDAAIESADIALMSGDLRRLPFLIGLSRSARRTIIVNIGFSLAVILFLVVSALAGAIRLSAGVFGHEGSALLVIANGMRLLKYSYREREC